MDLSARLQQLEELVLEAKSMPLSSSVLVSREELLQMISEMQESIPEEIKQARWIVKDREDLLGKARAEGERIVEQAHEDQRRLALKEEVARRAEAEAHGILEDAHDRAEAMRREAEDYVDAKLAQFEIALRKVLEDTQSSVRSVAKTLDQVEVGRERLRAPGTAADQALAPHDERPLETELYDEHGETDEVGRL